METATIRAPVRRITPPASLGEAEAKLFHEMVALCPEGHFVQSDAPLLASYCAATILARRAGRMLERDAAYAQVWEKAVRVQASLATRLRLSPQSRLDPKTTARAMRNVGGIGISASDYLAALTGEDGDDD